MKLGRGILMTALLLSGCSVYDYRYVFEPHPQVVETPLAAGGSLRALASVLGLRDSPSLGDVGPVVAVRVRIENTSQASIWFDPSTLVLRAGDGTPFGEPIPLPPGRQSVAAGSVLMVEAAFPLTGDADRVEWSGLTLEWTVDDGTTSRMAAEFTREPRAYYDRYPNRIGVGFQRFDTR